MTEPLVDAPWDAGRDRREGINAVRGWVFAGLFAVVLWPLTIAVGWLVVEAVKWWLPL